jgi:hypothetical protein
VRLLGVPRNQSDCAGLFLAENGKQTQSFSGLRPCGDAMSTTNLVSRNMWSVEEIVCVAKNH